MRGKSLIAVAVAMLVSSPVAAQSHDPGTRDALQLTQALHENGEYRVDILVRNDQPLSGMDIPLRFGQRGDSIQLKSVIWSDRVSGWELKNAAIDSVNKTVILGLISEVTSLRANAELAVATENDQRIATLVFEVSGGERPVISTFETRKPTHRLTFYYNRFKRGKPYVVEFTPEFDSKLSRE